MTPSPRPAKSPRPVFPATSANPSPTNPLPTNPSHTVFAFPPNRNTLGGTSYLIVENFNILVDCPAWDAATEMFLHEQGGVAWLVLTHRSAIAQAPQIQKAFNCKILIQEQEAYLFPNTEVTTFQHTVDLTADTRALWTPGHSPGSTCVYHKGFGGVLFTGRHLLPNPQGQLMPIKTATTFHWPRQLRSVQTLIDEFTADTLHFICPGANLGFLRGQLAIADGYTQLQKSRLFASESPKNQSQN